MVIHRNIFASEKWKKLLGIFFSLIFVSMLLFVTFTSYFVDQNMNSVEEHDPYYVTVRADSLHQDMTIMDWHSDTLLWDRSLLTRNNYGHVDLPRLIEGNVALQMFTTVTKSPDGQNYQQNDGSSDRITALIIAQLWPPKTWNSLLHRALYQAKKLSQFVEMSDGDMVFIKNKRDLKKLLNNRANGKRVTGALLGTEGAHPFEGDLRNIDKMYDAGFRMIGLLHFFDNEVGGSLHGVSKAGLTEFGREAVARIIEKDMIIDLAHASDQVVLDILDLFPYAKIVNSHTGLKGVCNTPRNLSDELAIRMAEQGALIAIGFWDAAVCDPSPIGIAKSIIYGIELVGVDSIALGSDWDGTVKTALTPDELSIITQTLMSAGLSANEISKIMGENSVNFLLESLPE